MSEGQYIKIRLNYTINRLLAIITCGNLDSTNEVPFLRKLDWGLPLDM